MNADDARKLTQTPISLNRYLDPVMNKIITAANLGYYQIVDPIDRGVSIGIQDAVYKALRDQGYTVMVNSRPCSDRLLQGPDTVSW